MKHSTFNKPVLGAIVGLSFLSLSLAAPKVEMITSEGTIVLELNEQAAPNTVANFVNYAKSGHYNGTIFHRVIDGFMIQGGGFDANMKQRSVRSPIKIESDNGLKNKTGTIAMARTSDPNSATSQFFINLVDNTSLDYTAPNQQGYGYAVFGNVVEGMDVVNKIASVPTTSKGPHQDVPKTNIVIEKVTVLEKEQSNNITRDEIKVPGKEQSNNTIRQEIKAPDATANPVENLPRAVDDSVVPPK